MGEGARPASSCTGDASVCAPPPAWFQIGADPRAFIRRVFRTLALDLPQSFELLPPPPPPPAPQPRRRRRGRAIPHARRPGGGHAPAAVPARRRHTPDDREAAMRRQPFQLDGTARLTTERRPCAGRGSSSTAPPSSSCARGRPATAPAPGTTSSATPMDENVRGQPIDPHLRCGAEDYCTVVFLRRSVPWTNDTCRGSESGDIPIREIFSYEDWGS